MPTKIPDARSEPLPPRQMPRGVRRLSADSCRTTAQAIGKPRSRNGLEAAGRAIALLLLLGATAASAADPAPIEARTAAGDVVLLHPNGRWAYADQAKAEAARKLADTYPENHTRPIEAQGGWFGVGRTIMPGDKDYNRGSMGGKGR